LLKLVQFTNQEFKFINKVKSIPFLSIKHSSVGYKLDFLIPILYTIILIDQQSKRRTGCMK